MTGNYGSILSCREVKQLFFFIHGAGGRSEQWFEQIKFLQEKKINVIVPDLLGHGRSSKPVGDSLYTTLAYLYDLEHIIQKYQTARTIVVGHSMGSVLAIHLVASQRVKVDSIVLLGTGYAAPTGLVSPIWKCPLCGLAMLRPLLSRASRKLLFHQSVSESFLNKEQQITNQNPFHVMKPLAKGLDWPSNSIITSISVPSLIIQGDTDLIFKDADALAKHLPGTQFRVVEKAGHNLMMEQPALISQLIWEFVKTRCESKSKDSS